MKTTSQLPIVWSSQSLEVCKRNARGLTVQAVADSAVMAETFTAAGDILLGGDQPIGNVLAPHSQFVLYVICDSAFHFSWFADTTAPDQNIKQENKPVISFTNSSIRVSAALTRARSPASVRSMFRRTFPNGNQRTGWQRSGKAAVGMPSTIKLLHQ
jgi:hypothetical protein